MLKYFVLTVFILSLAGQAFGEEPEGADFGVDLFNDTDGNEIPQPVQVQFNLNDKIYTIIRTPMNWYEGVAACSSKNQVMASVTSDDDSARLVIALAQSGLFNGGTTFWLGGSDLAKFGTWTWLDKGQCVGYTNWRAGEPNNAGGDEHCLELLSNSLWNDNNCYAKRPIICQKLS